MDRLAREIDRPRHVQVEAATEFLSPEVFEGKVGKWENYLDTEENSLLYTPTKKGLINQSVVKVNDG